MRVTKILLVLLCYWSISAYADIRSLDLSTIVGWELEGIEDAPSI
jgi:hypothetical protein